MDYQYEVSGKVHKVRVEPAGAGLAVTIDGETVIIQAQLRGEGEVTWVGPDGRRLRAFVASDGDRRWVALDPATAGGPVALSVPQAGGRRPSHRGGHDTLEAQMPGVVRRVLVAAGEAVTRGQLLLLLEAMKMEMRVTAPHAGRVERVAVAEGNSVQRGQVLIELLETDGEVT